MKKLLPILIFLLIATSVTAQLSSFVTDEAEVISSQDKIRIESVLKNIYDSKQAQYAVVIVKSLEGQDIESYALNLVQDKLGDTETNNGLLLLVSVEDRKYRFEVGRGIEPILNDAKVGRIARMHLVDNFKNGNYGQGILEASVVIANEFNVQITGVVPGENLRRSSSGSWLSLIMFFIIFSSIFGGYGRKYHRRNRYFNAALMAGLMFGGRRRGGFGGTGGMGGFSGGSGNFGGGGASGGF